MWQTPGVDDVSFEGERPASSSSCARAPATSGTRSAIAPGGVFAELGQPIRSGRASEDRHVPG